MKIDHINIAAPLELMETVKDFYCSALQLSEGPRPDFGIPGYWLYGDGQPLVHLIQSDQHQKGEAPPHLDHVAFQLTGLEAYTGRLDDLGVDYSAFFNSGINATQVFCQDPCGVGVEALFKDEQ